MSDRPGFPTIPVWVYFVSGILVGAFAGLVIGNQL